MTATEAIGLPAAVVILILAFGTVVAMGVPIVTALSGPGVTAAAIGLVAHPSTTPSFAPRWRQ